MSWRWLSPEVLVADELGRRVILTCGLKSDGFVTLLQSNKEGILVRFDPESEQGRLIARAPEMYELLKNHSPAPPKGAP